VPHIFVLLGKIGIMDAQLEGPAYGFFGIDLMTPSADGSSYSDIAVGIFWFIIIGFMFFAQHLTCDVYFVPAINVFVTKMRGSESKWLQRWGQDSVAGATICALGCNGPELFSNLISLYTHSDAGIGVVVGSEIFNLLVICGSSVLAAPIVPLVLEKLSFTRDVVAYSISIALLYWALQDKVIQLKESCILLGSAVAYVLSVYFTKDLEIYLGMEEQEDGDYVIMAESGQSMEGGDLAKFGRQVSPTLRQRALRSSGNYQGLEVDVEEIYHGRMVHHGEGRKDSWDGSQGMNDLCPIRRLEGQMQTANASALGDQSSYSCLKEVVSHGDHVIELEFEKGIARGMLLERVTVKITTKTIEDRDKIMNDIKQSALSSVDVHDYDPTIAGSWQHFKHQMHDKDMSMFLKVVYAVPELLIDGVLRLTLFGVDVKEERKENRWPLCFLGAMCWLAFFSWCMLECADMINLFIPAIPTSFLGITFCAVGTSFPNAVASVILSGQGKPGAAIANALGSNIQNVFLAMALPWVIYSTQYGGMDIPQNVAGIQEGILWMIGTLVLLLALVIMPPCCKITTIAGWILNAVYAIYAVVISGETFGWWPPLIQ